LPLSCAHCHNRFKRYGLRTTWNLVWREILAEQSLVLATPENGLIAKLLEEWDGDLASRRIPKDVLGNIRTYEAQLKPSRTYGVFVLCEPDEMDGGNGPFDAFVHVNHAFPRHPKPILRLTWNRIAPRFEWASDPALEHGRIFAAIASNALRLAQGPFKSSEIKIFLYNAADRQFGRTFASTLTTMTEKVHVAVRGNWLRLTPNEEHPGEHA
jgi:hypothetical protein